MPYSLYSTSWMDTGIIRHYSEAPLPLLIAAFLAVVAASAAARDRSLTVIAVAATAATFLGFPTELVGFGLTGYFALWTIARLASRGLKGPGNRFVAAAWLVLVAAWACGFPFTWTWTTTVCTSNLKNIGLALEMYHTDFQTYPTSLDALMPNYLKTIPQCNREKVPTYRAELTPTAYTIICTADAHKAFPIEPYASGPASSPTP